MGMCRFICLLYLCLQLVKMSETTWVGCTEPQLICHTKQLQKDCKRGKSHRFVHHWVP